MEELINNLIQSGILKTNEIINAFVLVDRADFVLGEYKNKAYEDIPLPIGFEQTISQPTTVAFMLELLNPKNGDVVLDVGSGSGWTTCLISKIIGERGKVYGVEIIPELVEFGLKNIGKYYLKNAEILLSKNFSGKYKKILFDKMLVSAESKSIPNKLLKQLKVGGVAIIPVRGEILRIEKISINENKIDRYEGFRFVPFINSEL